MSDYYVLDACALIAFLNDEAGADVVEELLRKSNRQEPNLFLHRLNLLEVYYGIYREVGPETSEQVLEKIRTLPFIEVTEITQEVFLEAGRLKATYRLSLADSIAAAEAKVRVKNPPMPSLQPDDIRQHFFTTFKERGGRASPESFFMINTTSLDQVLVQEKANPY